MRDVINVGTVQKKKWGQKLQASIPSRPIHTESVYVCMSSFFSVCVVKRGTAGNLNSKLIIVIVENFESFVDFKNILNNV